MSKDRINEDESVKEIETVDIDFNFEGEDSSGKYKSYFWCKAYTRKSEQPHFEVKTRVDNRYVKLSKDPVAIGGDLVKITKNEYEYDGVKHLGLNLMFEKISPDGDLQGLQWQCGWNNTLRSVTNCLLNCLSPVKTLTIKLYTNNAGYNCVQVLVNGQSASWKYTPKEMEEFKFAIKDSEGKILMWDNKKLDRKLEEELMSHLATILPNFDPTKEQPKEPKHEVDFVEESLDDFLEGKNKKVDEDDSTYMQDLMKDMEDNTNPNPNPVIQPSEQKLRNKKK